MTTRLVSLFKTSLRPLALVLGIGTFLAILGPFGSHAVGWPLVWIYWTGFIALGACVGYVTGHTLPKWLTGTPEWVIYAATTATVSVPVTFGVLMVNSGFSVDFDGVGVVRTYAMVLVISGFVTAVVFVIDHMTGQRTTGGATASAIVPPPTSQIGATLLDKLPVNLRQADIWAMNAEDHYLRVRTDQGEALILMRLSDAVAACEGLDGARTHRSWWVARAAVTDARKGDGRGTLCLKDGAEAPVSRTYYAGLREAGWF